MYPVRIRRPGGGRSDPVDAIHEQMLLSIEDFPQWRGLAEGEWQYLVDRQETGDII